MDISGTFTKVDNICHYSDGAIGWNFGTLGELRRGNRDSGDIGCGVDTANGHADNYEQAHGGVEGTTGAELGVNHAFFAGQTTKTTDIDLDVAPNGVVVDSAGETVAGKTLAVVVQVKVDTDATSGVQTAETMTWKYDVID